MVGMNVSAMLVLAFGYRYQYMFVIFMDTYF